METYAALRRRRMVRAFEDRDIDDAALLRVIEAGRHAPSAGFTQGVDLLVLREPAERQVFWRAETDEEWRRRNPIHEGTRRAPAIVIPLTGPAPYTRRYSEPDKADSGLSEEAAWPVPFWWVDGGMAVMAMLVAAVDEGLGALFTGVFHGEGRVREAFAVPPELHVIGALLLGWPAPDRPSPSLARGRRALGQQVHAGRYGAPFDGSVDAGPA